MQGLNREALYYAKPALRVSPYLSFSSNQVLVISYFLDPAIFKSLSLTIAI
jgi:hypothetical protein